MRTFFVSQFKKNKYIHIKKLFLLEKNSTQFRGSFQIHGGAEKLPSASHFNREI